MACRVLIAGAGAIGSVLGGLLAKAGHAVTLLGRASHLAAVAERGLALEGLWGEHRVRPVAVAYDAAALTGPYDAILVTVKTYDTASVLRATAGLLDPSGCMISMQNGLGNTEQVLATVGSERAVGARVIFGAEIPRAGVVRVTVFAQPTVLGAACVGNVAAEAHARAWAARLTDAGIPAEYSPDVQAHLWTKVFYNAALNPLSALFGLPYGALAADRDARAVMDAVIEEGYAVAAARGVEPVVPTAGAYREAFYSKLVPITAGHRSSMLQDLERGRSTEIEAINGCIWRYGEEAGVPTPVNATLTRLIRWRERLTATEARA